MSYSGRDQATKKQRVDISSNKIQIVLCQRLLEKLVSIVNSLEEGFNEFHSVKESSPLLPACPESSPTVSLDESVKEQFRAFKKLGEKTILRMSFSNFCFAWLLKSSSTLDSILLVRNPRAFYLDTILCKLALPTWLVKPF